MVSATDRPEYAGERRGSIAVCGLLMLDISKRPVRGANWARVGYAQAMRGEGRDEAHSANIADARDVSQLCRID